MTDTNATQIVILGGSGDLSRRKLLPALLDLFARGMLPETFNIIGLARSQWNRSEYADFVKKAIDTHHVDHPHTNQQVEEFCQHLTYVSGSFDDNTSYDRLQTTLDVFDGQNNVRSNRLFYLAVPPKFYEQIFTDLQGTGVASEKEGAWTHILVEKPFGNNLETAQKLDSRLAKLYREDQIFRIDHYLAKEAVQNILSFRFANSLLLAPWNKESIESVHVKMLETIDVGSRAGFYEGVGALRDVGQNHLLQLLALVAMKEPAEFSVDAIRNARAEILSTLKPITQDILHETVLRAQYEEYRGNDAIPDDSSTETYFELRAEFDTPEWENIPFYIQAGKAVDTAEVSITLHLKDIATGLFETESCLSVGNKIKLTISPEQKIEITLNAKSPGLGYQLETRTLSFTCNKAKDEIKNSYEKVLYDSIIGDQTLFTQTEEVLSAWKFITPILEQWNKLPLYSYRKGSSGPVETILQT
jgi:glucose-6-phosphate 1-dehydrogenase